MEQKPMKLLVIEDDVNACNSFIKCAENREDIEIIATTASDVEGIQLVKVKHPEGIILDLELNESMSGSTSALDFATKVKELHLKYEPIIIVTTHIASKRTYDILHRSGVDLILYKGHPTYSSEHVFNSFISLRKPDYVENTTIQEMIKNDEEKTSKLISSQLDLIGMSLKLKGREYAHDAILYLVENDETNLNVIQYLSNKYKKPSSTITNDIQNAIKYSWRVTSPDDILIYYKTGVNHETGTPTPMEFIYYYVDLVKKKM